MHLSIQLSVKQSQSALSWLALHFRDTMFKALVRADSDDKPSVCLSVSISAERSCWRSLSFPNYEKPYAETSVSTAFHYKRLQTLLVIMYLHIFNLPISVCWCPRRGRCLDYSIYFASHFAYISIF